MSLGTTIGAGLLGLGLLTGAPARAGALEDVELCLDRFDVACARDEAADLQGIMGSETDRKRAELWLAFHEGRYTEVERLLGELEAAGVLVEELEPGVPYRPTAAAAEGMVEATATGVRVRHDPGVDRILVHDALEVLEKSRASIDALFGGGPQHDIVLDIFPTASRFIAASGLPPESVRTTGVIALSKWTRLLLTSPRALSRGYSWKDTVAHEYIHLVVAYRSRNNAPVWLQEGLAKHLEAAWRGEAGTPLGVHAESLLADAVHSGEFVPFEKFARSMAYLDSGEEAALAFAQVATMIQFMLETSGSQGLPELMDRLAEGESAEQVVAELAGHGDFESFRGGWQAWLRTLPLVEARLAALPVVLDGAGDEFDGDPVLAGRADLARFTRLGDLLRAKGHPKAALVEYAKAEDPDAPASPLLLVRKAECHRQLDQLREATELVDEGVALYPEFTALQVARARLLDVQGQQRAALASWKAAHDLNPYNPEVQQGLVRGYEATGQAEAARRHLGYLRVLQAGGGVSTNDGSVPPAAP